MRRAIAICAVGLLGCAANAGGTQAVEETSQELVDGHGQRWYYVGGVGSEAATYRDPRWQNVDYDSLSAVDKAIFMRPEMIVGSKIYRLSDDDVMAMAELVDKDDTEVWEPGLGNDEPIPATYLRAAKYIFGSDSRSDASGSSHLYPWNNFASLNAGGHVCTAFKVYNQFTAMTAGHCFGDTWNYGPPWITFGDRSWSKPFPTFGRVNAMQPYTWGNQCFAVTRPSNYDSDNPRTDFAVFKFRDTNIGFDCGSANYAVGWLGKSYGYSDPQYIIGYPADPPGALAYPSLVYHGGAVHSGDDGHRSDTDVIDATGGQSGAPWIWVDGVGNWYAAAVHKREWWVPFDWENQGPSVHNSMWNLVPGWAGN